MTQTTQTRVPSLRFPEFSGEWEEKKLGEISQIYDGTHQTPKYVDIGVPFYSVEHLTSNNFQNTKFISEKVFSNECKRVKIEKGDILLTRIGDIGTNKFIDWDCRASFYVSLALIKPFRVFSGSFISHSLSATSFQRELWRRSIHVAFPKKINLGEIGQCKISLPTLPEQQKIANFLSAVDDKVENLSEQVALLERYKKGMMQKIFSQELRFKADDGSEFPAWEEKKLGDVFSITRGLVLAASVVSPIKTSDYKYPVFSSQTLKNGLMGYFNQHLYNNAITWTTDGANAGKTIYRKGRFYCTNVCGVLISEEGFANQCIAEMTNKVTHKYVSYVGNPKLMNNVMEKIQISFPSLPEQQKIADFLSAIDDKIDLAKQELEQAKTFKKGLLQQLFV
ncbi:MAG: restriction endonuclease subunit S [Gammaproteobacteria bacterium]|nr:restriction endonuclease subunit S [Gammaproteobacteria bacterium]